MLTPYEIARIVAEPGLPYLHGKTRADLRRLVRPGTRILDVGGRRSPYTVGLPARITVYDLPRETAIQHQLELGIDDAVLARLRKRRSNVEDVVFGDMTRCELPDATYDGIVAVEVIEHVVEDDAFVAQAARILRPGGFAYFTTPNGDYIPRPHPDHVRHYKRAELAALLGRHFGEVSVVYGVATGRAHAWGLRSIDVKKPLRALKTVIGNLNNRLESRGVEERATRTAHLFAIARKS